MNSPIAILQAPVTNHETPLKIAVLSFRLCLDGWNIGRMENIREKMGWKTQFHCLGMRGKSEEWKTGRNFSLPGPQNFSSQIRRKISKGKLHDCYFTKIPAHLPSFIPFTYPAEDFCPQIHFFSSSHLSFKPSSGPGSPLFSFSFFFFSSFF